MTHETWTQGNDEDELRAVCLCGWVGPWQDRIRAAYDDQAEHHRTSDIDLDPCKECHPELHRAQCWPNARCVAAEEESA